MRTQDERADKYVENAELDTNTYKGDVYTAYVVGCIDQEKIMQKVIDEKQKIIDKNKERLNKFFSDAKQITNDADEKYQKLQEPSNDFCESCGGNCIC